MKAFSVFDSATGRLLRTGMCPDDEVAFQANVGEHLEIEVTATPEQYLDPVTLQITTRPSRPSPDHHWSDETRSWGVDLAAVRSRVLKELKAQRDARVNGTFTWDGSVFDADPISQTRILGAAVSAAGAPQRFPVNWRTNDNAWRALSAADTSAVWDALQAHIQANFSAFATKEAQINALTTVEDLQTYDVTTGWPV